MIEIRHRMSGALLHTVDAETLSEANLIWDNLREANLSGANLSGADLRWADLSGADLSGANLREANLREANLIGANLIGADLRRADLRRADLRRANLREANLREADLSGADLREANLREADLSGADLSWADLSGANLSGVRGLTRVPILPDLDRAILDIVEADPQSLDMNTWHRCETTHCLAGWAVHLAGAEGAALEERLGTNAAGALIYHASTGRVPNFYTSNDEALAGLRERAAKPAG